MYNIAKTTIKGSRFRHHENVVECITKSFTNIFNSKFSLQASTLGTFNVVRLGVGLIAENAPDIDGEKGVIINTISAASGLPSLGQVANETASASIEAMTRVWAVEFAPQGIRTVAIAHGNIKEGKKSTKNALGAPQHFAQLAHMVVTMPYINATTITLDGAIKS